MTECITLPDGCEAVVLPSETIDEWAGMPSADHPPSLRQARETIAACREAVARRQPATERVPWWVAVADRRRLPSGHAIYGVDWHTSGEFAVRSVLGRVIGSLHDPAITGWDGSGTVEVLVKSEPRGASEYGQW